MVCLGCKEEIKNGEKYIVLFRGLSSLEWLTEEEWGEDTGSTRETGFCHDKDECFDKIP